MEPHKFEEKMVDIHNSRQSIDNIILRILLKQRLSVDMKRDLKYHITRLSTLVETLEVDYR